MSDVPDKRTHAARRREESREGSRLKLRVGQYIRRLHEIAERAEAVEPTAVPALRLKMDVYFGLLKKCLPDLKAIEHSGSIDVRRTEDLTDDELADIAAGSGAGVARPAQRKPQPDEVH